MKIFRFLIIITISILTLASSSCSGQNKKKVSGDGVEDYTDTPDDGSAAALARASANEEMTAADKLLITYCEVLNSPELKGEILSDKNIADINAHVREESLFLDVKLIGSFDSMTQAEVDELKKEFNYTIPESFKVGLRNDNPFEGTNAEFIINLIDSKNDTISTTTSLARL